MKLKLHSIIVALLFTLPAAAETFSFPFSPAADHLRVVAWNLEFFNSREPARTSEQLDALAQRIIGTEAAVVALQEMNQIAALEDLRDRIGDPWAVLTQAGQQNALLYDTSKVNISNGSFVFTHDGVVYPYEAFYRSPVTAVFSPVGDPSVTFRLIGIHGSWQNSTYREEQGFWLSDYVHDLLADQNEPRSIILLGDYNGAIPDPPHNGIVSDGDLSDVPKRNGDETTIYPDLKLDFIYATQEAKAQLTDPTSFVIRPEYYGETGEEFKAAHSDHLPVFIDYATVEITAGPTDVVYVDFGHSGVETGATSTPWNSVGEALGVLDASGTINIKGDTGDSDSAETFTTDQVIDQAATLYALNGAVTIGTADASPLSHGADDPSRTGFVSRP